MSVLNLSITVPDEKESDVLDALAYQNGYADQIQDENGDMVDNPTTKQQHIKAWILNVVRRSYKKYKDDQALSTALDNQTEDGSDFS